MDNVYLSADEYIEYTCEQADKIMQMKLGKDYDNYIVYIKHKGKVVESKYTEVSNPSLAIISSSGIIHPALANSPTQ